MNDDGSFTKPKNLGYPINDDKDQLGIVVSSDGEVAYFGANKLNGEKGWDVYEFRMPEKARPERVAIVKGDVKTEEGGAPQNAEVEIKYVQSGSSEKVKVNNDDGTYAAVVKMNKREDVVLQVKGEDVAFNSRVISRKEDTAPPVVLKLEMETQTVSEGKPFIINDIYYATARAEIESSSLLTLDLFAQYLIEHPSMEIEIRGHTDNVGNEKANLALSKERAFEVLTYLTSKGVDGNRMTYEGFGPSRPVADNSTEEGRAKNRRTEFVIRKM
jgi:outer membrane protein OmpA-like peptidoglycan-associated protein